ncbi:MAG: hypothetical protein IPM81_03965 [Saprospirales bacterium]|nr:hypothetical protein [Saprospirales bacterium]
MFFPQRFVCGQFVFAELPVSAGKAYGVAVEVEKHALYCSCPFRPKPCVHARALALLFEREGPASFVPAGELPDWVGALQSGRPALRSHTGAEQRTAAQTQRHLERLERAANGFDDLENWLLDTLRRGIATALSEDPGFYKNIAARLADASLRGLSRNFRTLEALPVNQADWPERVTAVLAAAALALHAFRVRERLPGALLHDLEAFIGIAAKKDQVLESGETLSDAWAVAGVVEEPVEEQLRVRRTWLSGAGSRRFALLLDYAFGEPEFPPGFVPGTIWEGRLTFYPSAWPLRALAPAELRPLAQNVENLPGFEDIEAMATAYAEALGKQPWLDPFPVALNGVIPYYHQAHFGLAGCSGGSLPLDNTTAAAWGLLAFSGGRPVTVFGEWNGHSLLALSALDGQRMIAFA